ncbi:MAG: hydantoinase B/oxoprolinase family protein, partial [Desulfatiglandaceae bacterium]
VVFRVPDDAYAPLPPVNLGIQSGRFRYPPEGLFDGKNGGKAQFLINGKPGNPYGLTQFGPGDVVVMDAAGGGGYGDPLERSLESVKNDVEEGYVSIERAKEDYGVVIVPDNPDVDGAQTERLRKSLKRRRP